VSVSSTGQFAYRISNMPSLSADGRMVAFHSDADSLVTGDTNNAKDIFVHDRVTHATTRVSVSSTGVQGNASSEVVSLSGDGRFVAFYSWASNLVGGDTNNVADVFVHDRQTGQTTRVSVSSAGGQGNGNSTLSAISADGRLVAFESSASNLVPGDTNNVRDIFLHDRQTGQTTRVSVNSTGGQSNCSGCVANRGHSNYPSLSADGRVVSFASDANNLVTGDTNNKWDVFVR